MGAPQCLECHTLHNTSKLQPVVKKPARGSSSFLGSSRWVLPKLHFPDGAAAHALLGPGLSPAQNGDFVSHLVLGTLLGLFLGTGPAGQVCKSMTHTQKPAASASHSCHLPTSHPFLPLPAQGSLPSLLPTSHFKGRDFPRGLHLPLSFVSDENDLLPARVHRITAQSSRRLHPPQPTPNY